MLEKGLESVRGDVATVQGFTHLGGEYEAVLPPQGARGVYLSPNWRSRWLPRASEAVRESFTLRRLP